MSKPLDYRELIYQKDGLLVVQIKKGYYQLRHWSGRSVGTGCARSKSVAMQLFDEVFPLFDWRKSAEEVEAMPEEERLAIAAKVGSAVGKVRGLVKTPEED